jgi:predicted phosphoadenosine phosphosulfate sulfurtransferase
MDRVYLKDNVLEKAKERVSLVFDNFKDIIVSVSGGKDSTTLYWLALEEAIKRNRKINLFFLDQEAEYQGSIDLLSTMMRHPSVVPMWYQIPLKLTNATSYKDCVFYAWEKDAVWVREKDPISIHDISEDYSDRFYTFFNWLERNKEDTAFLVGLRAEESLNRLRAVIRHPGWMDVLWSTKTRGRNTYRFYPIYDWGLGDVWKYINDNKLPYNRVYDKIYWTNGLRHKTMRISNLIHEKSFKCLSDLQVYEPETFNKLIKRLRGVHVASIYSNEGLVFNADKLPSNFKSWKEFRDYLLEVTPLKGKDKFIRRFESQGADEEMCRRHVRQLFLNDYENNLNVSNSESGRVIKDRLVKEWWDRL